MANSRPSLVTRLCLNSTGPLGSSILTATAIMAKSQQKQTSTRRLKAMSKARLAKRYPWRLERRSAAAATSGSAPSSPSGHSWPDPRPRHSTPASPRDTSTGKRASDPAAAVAALSVRLFAIYATVPTAAKGACTQAQRGRPEAPSGPPKTAKDKNWKLV